MASSPITLWQIEGETMEAVTDFIFLGSKITVDGDFSPVTASWNESHDKPRQCIKKQRHAFAAKGQHSQSCGFPSSHVTVRP